MGDLPGDLWEEALEAVQFCSLNVAQRLFQLYILLRVHRILYRLHFMGLSPDPVCNRCHRDVGDLINLL